MPVKQSVKGNDPSLQPQVRCVKRLLLPARRRHLRPGAEQPSLARRPFSAPRDELRDARQGLGRPMEARELPDGWPWLAEVELSERDASSAVLELLKD